MANIIYAIFLVLSVLILAYSLPMAWNAYKPKKKPLKEKMKRNLIEEFYTREQRLLEIQELITNHGSWTYNTAKKAIEERMILVRETLSSKGFSYTCPVCRMHNWRTAGKGTTIGCKCPSNLQISRIYRESQEES